MSGIISHDAAQDWVRLGATNPYFGVLSDARFHGRALDEDLRGEFFASGHRHVAALTETLHRCFGAFERGTALDFGCGVGRISQALAGTFAQVVGLDVSPGMLAEARRNAAQAGVTNAEYRDSTAPGSIPPGSFDLVHSYIVLQHIPVAVGEPIIEQLIAAVRSGGIGALHVTITPAQRPLAVAVRNLVKRNRDRKSVV